MPLGDDNLWSVVRLLRTEQVRNAKNIIHIQWPTVLYGSRFFLKSVFLLARNILLLAFLKSVWNFKVVWTVHNFYAHDYPYPSIDRFGQGVVRMMTDHIIVQQESTLQQYRKKYSNKKIDVVPHANYIGVYGPAEPAQTFKAPAMRQKFGFKDSDIVLLSLGVMAPYKKNEKIIEAFARAKKENKNLVLLIIGKGKGTYVDSLNAFAQKIGADGVVVRNEFVPDEEIPTYMAMADYSVFYYDGSEMTSGGLILSLSYGLPVITRNIPAAEIVNEKNGFVFDNTAELAECLTKLKKRDNLTEEKIRHDSIESVKNQSWLQSAQKLTHIYGQLN